MDTGWRTKLRRAVSWYFVMTGVLSGVAATAVLGGMDFGIRMRPLVFIVVSAGVLPAVASLVAVCNPRLASRLYIGVAAIAPFLFLVLSSRDLTKAAVAVLFLGTISPALFWFVTTRKQWPVPLPFANQTALKVVLTVLLLCLVSVGTVALSLCLPWWSPIGDCGSLPLLDDQGLPVGIDFTAQIVYIGPNVLTAPSLWSIARVETRYSAVQSWGPNLVILRGFFQPGDKSRRYFVEGWRSRNVFGRIFPVIEPLRCGHTDRLDKAAVQLRILRDGRPKSGARIIGAVFRGAGDLRKVVSGAKVNVVGPTSTIELVTDEQGIYEIDLPVGTYTVELAALPPSSKYTLDLKTGDIAERTLFVR